MNRLLFAPKRALFQLVLAFALFGFETIGFTQSKLNVSLVGQHKPPQASTGFGDVWGDGNLACLGVWTAYNTFGFGIYSITNPASPQLLTVYNFGSGVANRFEQGVIRSNILYVGSWGGSGNGSGLHILSLANPASPAPLSRITASTPGTVVNGFNDVHTLFLERNFLYLAAHNVGIVTVKVFDVSNPALPVFVRDVVTTNTTRVHQMTVRSKGDQVVLYTSGWGDSSSANSPGQTDLWDVTTIGTQPAQWLGRIFSGFNSHSSWPTEDGNTLIVCREATGGDVRLYDISNPGALVSNTPPIAVITPAGMGLPSDIPHNPVVVGNHLFLSWYQNGLQIFDITNPARPVRVGFFDTFPGTSTSSFQGNWGVYPRLGFHKVLLSDIQGGFYVVDASAVLTPTNNYPPMFIRQPASLAATQGGNAVFAPDVTGSLLNYQWRFNGANLPGATSSDLILSNVQPAQAGSYSLVASNATAVLTSSVAALSITIPPTPLFSDDFDSASASNNLDFFSGSANGIDDYTLNWSFNYSTYFSAFNGAFIPPAPGTTNGTTRGLRLAVNNNDGIGATAGVSLYPRDKFFTGAYRLTFDVWVNYPGGVNGSGSTGSTEHFTAGLNHSGTRVNWHSANPSDGLWFAMDGEGGTSIDYRSYVGEAGATPALLSASASGFNTVGASSRDHTDAYWQSIFPAPAYESAGAPGKKWTRVELSQDTNNVITWRMNGNLIAQRTNTSAFTNGNIMIGYMDLFTSIASPAADAFVIFDNVRVEMSATVAPPSIAMHPESISVYPEADAEFTVAATGGGTPHYQWLFNGDAIPDATNNSYTRTGVQPEHAGNYSVIVSNETGVAVSSNALLTLLDSPYVSGVQATPGARSALISWNTTVLSDSQVQFDPATFTIPHAFSVAAAAQGSLSSSSHTDPELTTNHIILLTGLQPGTRYSFQTLSTAGTNTYVSGVYQFTTAGTIILDNTDAALAGSWTEGTSLTDKFGTNYLFTTSVAGTTTATATWRPKVTTPGKYDVSVWYPEGGNHAADAPYSIAFNGGLTNVLVNQRSSGGAWWLIAAGVEFAKGTNGFVRLANHAGPSVVIADAVKFAYVEAQDFPTNPATPTWWQNFYFSGPVEPTLDADGDRYTTAQEYVMGTSPTNSNSHLHLSGSNSTSTITFWPHLADRNYDLIYRTNLNSLAWEKAPVSAPTPTPDGHGVFTLTAANDAQSYYRLKIQLTTNTVLARRFALPGGFATFTTEAACGPFRIYVK